MALSLHASMLQTMVLSLEARLWHGGGVVATWLELGTVDLDVELGATEEPTTMVFEIGEAAKTEETLSKFFGVFVICIIGLLWLLEELWTLRLVVWRWNIELM